MAIDETKLKEFLGRAVGDVAAAMSAVLVVIGDRLGLYQAMAGAGPLTPAQLAERAGIAERYAREWLSNQAAGGYVAYDADSGRFTLPPEQARALADESSPVFLAGAFEIVASMFHDEPKITRAFRSGEGVGWHEHHQSLFDGGERSTRPRYLGNLVNSWIPALDGMVARLRAGARVADVGCGSGASTILMARSFPQSRFTGFDTHAPSIERARAAARAAGVEENTRFEIADSKAFPGTGWDLVAFFDCLHDMGDPVGVAAHVRRSLAPEGLWMIVEPYARDRLEENLTPLGRLFYAASTMVCVPASLAQEGRAALGTQAGEARIREVATKGGFRHFRRAVETPFNLVFEARP
jgi:SAM-dependent methyltransferase